MSLIYSSSNSVPKPIASRSIQQHRSKRSEPLQPADVVVGNNATGSRAAGMHAASYTATTASYWTNSQGTGGEGWSSELYKPPYMDVQTVKTNLTVDQAAKLEGQSHCLLLVEPVLLPDLGHTGVTKEVMPGDRPLFYPNGCKNCGLGSTIRNTLFESTSSRPTHRDGGDYGSNNNFGFHPKHQRHHQQKSQQPPSDWASSSAYNTPSDSYSSVGGSSKHSKVLAAIPSGQGGESLADVWGTPSSMGTINKRNLRHRGGGSNSRAIRVDRTLEQTLGAGESKFEEVPLGCSARQNVSKGNALPSRQSRNGSNQAYSESKNSTSGSSKVSLGSSVWGGTVDAGGRDSEWAAERRAADREAKEVVGALRHNSTRLWLLVGGGL